MTRQEYIIVIEDELRMVIRLDCYRLPVIPSKGYLHYDSASMTE